MVVRGGFDAFVGNPPFAGKNLLQAGNRDGFIDWLQATVPDAHGSSDLVAYFFRGAFARLRDGGTMGMVATNSIAQGDTRFTGLRWICTHGGEIFDARRRIRWSGTAAVVVCAVHIMRGVPRDPRLLDGKPVAQISAFLFPSASSENPALLASNRGRSLVGAYVLGAGFAFDDAHTEDGASPLALMNDIITRDPRSASLIAPYMGGEQVNSSPTLDAGRYIIDFGEMSKEQAREWPDLFAIVEDKVQKSRRSVARKDRRETWWLYATRVPEARAYAAKHGRLLIASQVSTHLAFVFCGPGTVLPHTLAIILMHSWGGFAVVQARVHEAWVVGITQVCVVESDQSVWCWGSNYHGELGHTHGASGDVLCGQNDCNATPTKVAGVAAKQVSIGRWSACAVTTDDSVACWGWNGDGELGLGGGPTFADNPAAAPAIGLSNISHVQVDVFPGDNACAIDSASKLWCWGSNIQAQLGHSPGTLGDATGCGESGPGSDACNATPQKVTLGLDGGGGDFSNVASVAPSWATCASQLGGSVWCWGTPLNGELGQGYIPPTVLAPTELSTISGVSTVSGDETLCSLGTSGEVDCWGQTSINDISGTLGVDAGCHCTLAPTRVTGLSAKALSSSFAAAATITADGVVVAWGSNYYGELGHALGTSGDDANDDNPTPTPVQGLP